MALAKPQKSKIYHKGKPFTNYESYSSISKWLRCPVEFAQIYFEHDREPSTLNLVFGNAFHALVEATLIDKQLSGPGFTPAKARSRWEACWQTELNLAMTTNAGLKIETRSPEVFFEQGLECTDVWMSKWYPKIDPRDVEIDFMLTLRGIPRKLYGRLDFTQNGDGLHDIKTSGRPYKNALSEYELQFGIYHVGHYSIYHAWPKMASIIRVETERMADIEEYDIMLTRERVQQLFDEIVRPAMVDISKAWETGIFECTCKRHQTFNFYEEIAKRELQDKKKSEKDEKLLNPEAWAKKNFEQIVKEAITNLPQPDIKLEEIPF